MAVADVGIRVVSGVPKWNWVFLVGKSLRIEVTLGSFLEMPQAIGPGSRMLVDVDLQSSGAHSRLDIGLKTNVDECTTADVTITRNSFFDEKRRKRLDLVFS